MSSVVEGLKQAASTLRAADKIPEYNSILDAQQKIFDLQNENQELKQTIQKMKSKDDLEFEPGHNWLVDPKGDKGRHFCTICWDKDGIRCPLWNEEFCTRCKSSYE